jgi:hypothetical protein
MRNGRARRIPKRNSPVLLSANPLATAPGWSALDVTPDPSSLRDSSLEKRMFASFAWA